jgi:hypothetical protein
MGAHNGRSGLVTGLHQAEGDENEKDYKKTRLQYRRPQMSLLVGLFETKPFYLRRAKMTTPFFVGVELTKSY